jgi:LPXTG-motif cell wall-anchored protein
MILQSDRSAGGGNRLGRDLYGESCSSSELAYSSACAEMTVSVQEQNSSASPETNGFTNASTATATASSASDVQYDETVSPAETATADATETSTAAATVPSVATDASVEAAPATASAASVSGTSASAAVLPATGGSTAPALSVVAGVVLVAGGTVTLLVRRTAARE